MTPTPAPSRDQAAGITSGLAASVVAATLAGGLLVAAARQGLWYDETYTAGVVGLNGSEFVREVTANDQSFALTYLAIKASTLLAGTSDVALRSLSVVAHVSAVLLFWRPLRARLGSWPAAAGSVALFAGILLLRQAVTARGYALLELGIVVLLALTLEVAERGSRRAWRAAVPVAAVLPFLHPIGGVSAGIALLGTMWSPARRHGLRLLPGGAAITGAWGLCGLLVVMSPDPHANPPTSLYRLLGTGVFALGGFWIAVASLPLVVFAALRREAEHRELSQALVGLVVVPAAAAILLFLTRQPSYPRYFLGAAIGVAGLVGVAVARLSTPGRVITLALAALALAQLVVAFWPNPTGQYDDWRVATSVVRDTTVAGDGLITPSPHLRVPLDWYSSHGVRMRATPIWPDAPWGSLRPSAAYQHTPFDAGTSLPAQLPDTVWLVVDPGMPDANDAAAAALEDRGYVPGPRTRLWSDPRAPELVLVPYRLS